MMKLASSILALAMLTTGYGLAQSSPEAIFEAGVRAEMVDGDLAAAISIFTRVVEQPAADRTLVARALLRIGACYEKLGREEARAAYAQVVDQFADQTAAAAQARERLVALEASETRDTSNRVAGGDGMTADRRLPDVKLAADRSMVNPLRVSPDGRRLLFLGVTRRNGELNIGLHDYEEETTTWLTDHTYTPPYGPRGVTAVWSPDGNRVAFSTLQYRGQDEPGLAEIHVSGPDETPRRLFRSDEGTIHVTDWLRDGSALVVELQRPDQSVSLGLVSLSDGTFLQLRTLTWAAITMPTASPDGRYILYEDGTRDARDLYLLATDGTSLAPIDDHPAIDSQPLFSPDGRHVVFQSNRGGRDALWAVAVDQGRPAGEPFTVTGLADGATLLQWTERGLVYWARHSIADIFTAPIDPDTGAITAEPTMVPFAETGSNRTPRWSPDGRYLGFLRGSRGVAGRQTLVLLPLDGSRAVEVATPEEAFYDASNLQWKPDGSELSLIARDRQGKSILIRLSPADRRWTVQPLPEHLYFYVMDWAPSWEEFFFYNFGEPAFGLMRADLETGRQELMWESPRQPILALNASADGRRLAFTIRQRIWIFDRQTGSARQIPDIAAIPYGLSWSPDGRRLLYTGTDSPGTGSAEGTYDGDTVRLRLLDVASGRSTDVRGTGVLVATAEPGAIREPVWAPDGSRIAFSLNETTFEMRLLEAPLASVDRGRTNRRER